jgi:hypothetical protein
MVPPRVRVFVSAHTHAPALTQFRGPAGQEGAIVNSGCWLRQLQPLPARLGVPQVFVSRFVQTHVRASLVNGTIEVELWEHPRPSRQRMPVAERLAMPAGFLQSRTSAPRRTCVRECPGAPVARSGAIATTSATCQLSRPSSTAPFRLVQSAVSRFRSCDRKRQLTSNCLICRVFYQRVWATGLGREGGWSV